MKKLLIFITIFIAITLFGNTDNQKKLEKVSVQLHWKYQYEFAGFIIALEKGFYKDLGLDVELKEYKHNTDIEDEVISGRSNYGIYNSNILISYLEGKPVKLLSSYFKRSAMVLITKPNIKSIKDLVGKKIMSSTKKDFDLNFKCIFDSEGVDIDDLTLIPHTFNIEDFKKSDCDAMTAFMSDQPYQLDKENIEYNIINPTDYGIYNLQLELFTSDNELLNYPKRTKLFTQATIKGWEYAFENEKEVIDLIHKKYAPHIDKDVLQNEAKAIRRLVLPDIYKVGSFDKNFLKRQIEIFKKQYNIKSSKSLNNFFSSTQQNSIKLNLSKEEKAYLQKHKVLRVHNEQNWAPFNFNESGIAKGYSVDYIEILASKIGVKVEYISGYSWEEFVKLLATPKLDLIINISQNKDRLQTMCFSDIFLSTKNAIYVNKNNPNFNFIEDLKGKKIAMIKGFYAQEYLEKEYPMIEQVFVKDIVEAAKLLSFGKVDAIIAKKVVTDYIIQKHMISNIFPTRYIENEDMISYMRIGASKQDQILIDILKKGQKLISNEEKRKLQIKWFSVKMDATKVVKLSQKEQQYLAQKKEIKVCVDPNWMPFEKIEKGKHIGLASDFLKIIAKRINTPMKLVVTSSWDESLQKAKNKECDILSMASQTPSRKKYMDATKPYLLAQIVIAAKSNKIYIDDLSNHLDKVYGVVKGYSLHETLKRQYPTIKLQEVDSIKDGLEQVYKGKIFGYLDNSNVIMYEIKNYYLGSLTIVGEVDNKIEYRVHTRNDEKILNTIFNKAIDSIGLEERQQIRNKWLEYEYDFIVDYTLIWKILFGSLLIISIILHFLIKQSRLKQKIQNLNLTLEDKVKSQVSQIKKSNSFFTTVFETVKEGIVIIDYDFKILIVNSCFKKLINHDTSELKGKAFIELLDKNKRYNLIEIFQNTIKNGQYNKELQYNEKDFVIDFLLMEDQNNILCIIKDVTQENIYKKEQEIQQKQILQQTKLAQMGEMIGNISHQWRQPLSEINAISMKIYSQFKANKMTLCVLDKDIEKIENITEYMSDTIGDFTNFFKKDKYKKRFLLKQSIQTALKLFGSCSKKYKINIILDVPEIMLETYEGELVQVVIAILQNAKDAIQIKNTENGYIKIVAKKEQKMVVIEISDNGGGIPADVISRIFEPYFTTKFKSQGVGVGLYMSNMIMSKSIGGTIDVENIAQGVKFRLEIPYKSSKN